MNMLRTGVVMTKSNFFRFVYFMEIVALITSISVRANAFELSESVVAQTLFQHSFTEAVSQKQSDATDTSKNQSTNPTNSSTDNKSKQPNSKIQEDETVKVDDIPLECRSYFSSNDLVNLLDYQQGMQRCRYGSN